MTEEDRMLTRRKNIQLFKGDCLDVMKMLPAQSVDLILCDLPYGTTACSWDAVIPFEPLWEQYWRVLKPNGAVVLTSAQPFTTALNSSQIKHFKYEIIWDKVNRYTGALQANKRPMRRHENISVFAKRLLTYNKQFREGKAYSVKRTGGHGQYHGDADLDKVRIGINDGNHNPCSIVDIKADVKTEMGLHPTQKPVALMEYMIRTYTNEGDTVLDNCMGSGTTGVAALNTGRRFIGIERDWKYFKIAEGRISGASK